MCFKFMKCDMKFPFLMNAKLIDGQFKFLKQNFFFPNNSFFFLRFSIQETTNGNEIYMFCTPASKTQWICIFTGNTV